MRDEAVSTGCESLVTRHATLFSWRLCVFFLAASCAGAQEIKDGGPYVPTPQKVVEAMLDLAGVRANDFVMDLGSGDGRIVLTAATRNKARGIGVDIDQELSIAPMPRQGSSESPTACSSSSRTSMSPISGRRRC